MPVTAMTAPFPLPVRVMASHAEAAAMKTAGRPPRDVVNGTGRMGGDPLPVHGRGMPPMTVLGLSDSREAR